MEEENFSSDVRTSVSIWRYFHRQKVAHGGGTMNLKIVEDGYIMEMVHSVGRKLLMVVEQ